jgi:hypothetical protein
MGEKKSMRPLQLAIFLMFNGNICNFFSDIGVGTQGLALDGRGQGLSIAHMCMQTRAYRLSPECGFYRADCPEAQIAEELFLQTAHSPWALQG